MSVVEIFQLFVAVLIVALCAALLILLYRKE